MIREQRSNSIDSKTRARALRSVHALAAICGHLGVAAFAACGSSPEPSVDPGEEGAPGSESMNEAMDDGTGTEPSTEPQETPVETEGTGATPTEGQSPDTITNIEPPVTAPPPTGSSGCNQSATPVTGARTLDVEGQARTYVLDVPADYDGTRALPIVFGFHGATTSGEFFRSRFYGNLLSAMGEEAIVVHPDALGDPTQWGNGDVPFFDALFAALQAELCIDEERVFATGHSSGGFFTNTLGCQRGEILRGIAPVSGGGPFTFGGFGGGGNACTGEVAVWIAHGENDETVPFQSGVDSRDRWLDANGCGEMTSAVAPEPCQEYASCGENLPVRFCVYQDGHNWPDFAPQGIWEFFSGL